MSTDKILADVQPGGWVRLGDSLPPLPEPSVTGYGFDSVLRRIPMPGFTAEQMRDYALAALSAQPSPGGQDVRAQFEVWARWFAASVARSDDGEYASNFTNSLWLAWQAALAARQPVGEPVGTICDRDGVFEIELSESANDTGAGALDGRTVYLAQPAQAVDLGQFREAVLCWRREQWSRTTYFPDAESSPGDNVERADRLLALIDSGTGQAEQAVDLGQLPRAVELLSNVSRTLVDWAAEEQREAIGIVKALIDSHSAGGQP